MKAIVNAKVICKDQVLSDKAVLFEDKIKSLVPCEELKNYEIQECIDAGGNYLSPGFIDIHIHGCNNSDTMEGTETALKNISLSLAKVGVTAFLAATMTMDALHILNALKQIKAQMQQQAGAQVLGCHLEGPFINAAYKGAQDEAYIIKPDFDVIEEYKDCIRLITLAPEMEGSREFISRCVKHGIGVSIGHTDAAYEQAWEALTLGAKSFTHTYNAMSPFHHRKPGTAGAALDSEAYCELIADNIHVHPAAQRILLKSKTVNKVILVSDAISACMMKDGSYSLGGQDITVDSGIARLKDKTLAGSTITMNKAVYNFMKNTGLGICDAIKPASTNPAALLELDSKGSVEPGRDADMVVFDEELDIKCTIVGGRVVYQKS